MENYFHNTTIESTLARYLEFRIFELVRDRLVSEISPHCREGSKEDLYKHLFLCPSDLSKRRNFQLHGVLSPFVCLWRTSPLSWNKDMYGRSVLPRDFMYYDANGQPKAERGFLYDIEFDMELFSSSYYKTFRDRVNQDLLDMDRLRYFSVDVSELLKEAVNIATKIEFMLGDIKVTDNINDGEKSRSFDLNAAYTVKATIPYCHSDSFLKGIEVYLNERLIYMHDGEEEIVPGIKG